MSRIYQAPPVKGRTGPPPRPNNTSSEDQKNDYVPRGRTGSVHTKPQVHSPFDKKPEAEDFQTKLARLRAKVDAAAQNPNGQKFELKNNYNTNAPARRPPPRPAPSGGGGGGAPSQRSPPSRPAPPNNNVGGYNGVVNNHNNNNNNYARQAPPSNNNYNNNIINNNNNNNNNGIESSSNMDRLGLRKAAPRKRQWKKLNASKAARAAGRNEEAIKVNLDSIKSKTKFGRLVVYSVNCLANLAENRFNCESIVEQGGIPIAKDVILHHKGNPAVMKEVSRMVANVAKADPAYAKQMADEGLLEQCLDVVRTNPRECGVYALEIIDAILNNNENKKDIADRILKAGGIEVLTGALQQHMDNPQLASAIIETLNLLTQANPNVGKILGSTEVYKQIMDAMKMHPGEGQLAINGTQALKTLAMLDPRFLKGIQEYDGVAIISNCMQANPDLKQLVAEGAAALKILAGQDDVTKALNVLFDPSKFDDVMITQALGLLANLALIAENADYIESKGGLDALLGLINFHARKGDLTPAEIEQLAGAIRATGRLLQKPGRAIKFQQAGGVDQLNQILSGHGDEETIVNAVMDALQNLSKTQEGQRAIVDSGIMQTATKVLQDNPDYAIMMQKYADLVRNLPIQDRAFIQPLIDGGMLDAISKCMIANYDDPDTMIATADLIKDLAHLHPYLASGLAQDNANGFIQSIRANQDNPEVLKHIFDAIHALAAADPNIIGELKKAGLEDLLLSILKKDGISDAVAAVVKDFYDSLVNDGIEADLTQVLATLNGLGMPLDELDVNLQESEVKQDPKTEETAVSTWTDPNVVLNGLSAISGLLGDPGYAKQFVTEGQVGNVLDNIQTFYTDPKVVVPALDVLTKCAQVPGVFPLLEEAGVVEGIIQCMLEHPDDHGVQYAGVKALGALASHTDPLVTESICQPINIETALKALSGNITDPNMAMAFADLVSNLMDDEQNAPQIAQMLASEGVVDALTLALNNHQGDPNVTAKINQALSKLNPYLFNPEINQHGAQVNPYGTISLAQLSQMTPEELQKLMAGWDHDELMTTMRAAKDPKLVTSGASEVDRRLKGGDAEVYNDVVSGGGIGDLLGQAQNNVDNPMALGACLDALGTLSGDDRLKTLLGMHGTIRLILECIRRHPNDLELLDKCCYILSNLSFNNAQNMTSIIELGGVNDITGVLKKNKEVNFLCESAINVLVNLCHNSEKNKVLIARSGGAKATIQALKQHNRCTKDGDEPMVVSAFRCLANLAYAPENVKSLIKQDVVAVVMDTMNHNTDHRDLIQMGVVVLANLSAHERSAAQMVHLGVLDLIIRVSESYADELEIQRSCLGCVGNLMNEQSNAVAFMDKNGHKRIFEIMEELVFEESVVQIALKLLKVLATNSDIATSVATDGGIEAVVSVMKENISNPEILSLGCQALCKLVCTMEAAKYITKTEMIDVIVQVSKENNNWANIQVMNELVKVVVNFAGVEENAQPYARQGAVPLLRAIEAHGNNPIFLNNAAMALSKLAIHPPASRPLVKRGAIPVIISSCTANAQRRGIITRYVRTLTNFLYTEHKTGEELSKVQGYEVLQGIIQQHQDYGQLMSEWAAFEKAMKLKSKKYAPTQNYSVPIRDRMQMANSRLIGAGTIMKKYDPNGKAKKRLVRGNDDCTLLVFEDPNGKKAPKQMNMKSVKEIRAGNSAKGLENVRQDTAFAIVSVDPNGREFALGLETKSAIECQRWVAALQDMVNANQNGDLAKGGPINGSQMNLAPSASNLNSGSQMSLSGY